MAPATFAGASFRTGTGRPGTWDRDSIIEAIQEWVALHGEPPRAADWNPSSAKWSGQLWRVERYRAGRPDGSPWPALNAAKRPFDGSLSAAIRAAGYEPARPGPRRRRDVEPEQAARAIVSPEGRAMIDAALARARDATRRIDVLERRLERSAERLRAVGAERDAARRAHRAARDRVASDAAAARAAKVTEAVAAARMDAAEARSTAKGLAARLERCEATVATLRAQRRELRADVDAAVAKATEAEAAREAAEAALAAARAAPAKATRPEAAEAALNTMRVAARMPSAAPRAVTPSPRLGVAGPPTLRRLATDLPTRPAHPDAAALREARAEALAAKRAAEAAELREAAAVRELHETLTALRGTPRRLGRDELAELRRTGPAGPAVLATALAEVAAARKAGSGPALRSALKHLAEAAITWQERI